MTKSNLYSPTVKADDFYDTKTREFLRALEANDSPAVYFLEQDNEYLRKKFKVVPPINFSPTADLDAERFQTRYRDLTRAIFANDHLSVELCLREYPLFLQTYNGDGESLEHVLCRAKNADLLMANIISDKKSIFLDSFGNTPLNLAAMFNRYDLVDFFSGFQDPTQRNFSGQNAFDFAFFNNNTEIINLLIHRSIQPVLTEFQFQDYQQQLPNENQVINEILVGELRVNSNLDLEQVTTKTITADLLEVVGEDQKEGNSVVKSEVLFVVKNIANPPVTDFEIPIAIIAEKSKQEIDFSKNNPEAKKSQKEELRIKKHETKLMSKEDNLSKAVEKDISNKAKQEVLRQAQIEKSKLEKSKLLEQKEKEEAKKKEEEDLLQSTFEKVAQQSQKLEEIKNQKILLFKNFLDEISRKYNIQNLDLSKTDNTQESLELSKRYLQEYLFISAIKTSNTPLMEEILNHPVASEFLDLERKGQDEETPLIFACRFGAFKIADLLINKGVNVKAIDKNHQSALHWCARYSGEVSFNTAKTIFEKSGNDVNFLKAHSNGMSVAMNCCRENGNDYIFKMVMDECKKGGQDYDSLEKKFFMNAAYQKNNLRTVEVLNGMGLTINSFNYEVLMKHIIKETNNRNNSSQPTGTVKSKSKEKLKDKDKNPNLGKDIS